MIGQPAANGQTQDQLVGGASPASWTGEAHGGVEVRSEPNGWGWVTWPWRAFVSLVLARVRRLVARQMPNEEQQVLEVGVGRGQSLGAYPRRVHVTGIDADAAKLRAARARVAAHALDHVHGLHRMSADALRFPDGRFDRVAVFQSVFARGTSAARKAVVRELSRVVKTGGRLVLIERSSALPSDMRSGAQAPERKTAAAADASAEGQRASDWFAASGLRILGRQRLDPIGLFTALCFEKAAEPAPAA